MGIPELRVEHYPVPPVGEWTEMRPSQEDPSILLPYLTFPPGAIVVLDEAQRVFRPQAAGKAPPPEIQAFETRRHTGVDFVLISQHPGLIHSNLRRLVTRHVHIYDTFVGRYLLEWVGPGDPENKASRAVASRQRFQPPKSAFDLYKSSELHTKIVRKYPWYMWAFCVLVPLAIGLSYYSFKRISSRMDKQEPAVVSSGVVEGGVRSVGQGGSEKTGSGAVVTAEDYIKKYTPRVAGLMHTAPVYDQVTTPQQAPEPVGCIQSSKSGCKCYTQQGTVYRTNEDICRQLVVSPMYIPWRQNGGQDTRTSDRSFADKIVAMDTQK